MTANPAIRPERPWFSSGPTAKRPGWSLAGLPSGLLGRGIRAPEVVARFAYALELTNAKFIRRFRAVEDEIVAGGRRMKDCTLAEMDAIWDKIRAADKKR